MKLLSRAGWILGLDVAKLSVQAELHSPCGGKLRFNFDNNAAGFKKLARVLEQHGCTLVQPVSKRPAVTAAP